MADQRQLIRSGLSPKPRVANGRKTARYRLPGAGRAVWEVIGDRWTAVVFDMSIGGISLIADRPFDAGTVLCVNLQTGATSAGRTARLRVARAQQRADGRWLIGCTILDS
jgi:hypothetical protein